MIFFLAIVFFGKHVLASPKICTQMGCDSGFHLRVDPQKIWPAGNYLFRLELDGKKIQCKGSLPLPPCERRALQCEGKGEVQIMESGCALDRGEHRFGDLHFPKMPKKISVTILRDGKSFAEWKGEASYKKLQPNGNGCEPICHQASAELLLK